MPGRSSDCSDVEFPVEQTEVPSTSLAPFGVRPTTRQQTSEVAFRSLTQTRPLKFSARAPLIIARSTGQMAVTVDAVALSAFPFEVTVSAALVPTHIDPGMFSMPALTKSG